MDEAAHIVEGMPHTAYHADPAPQPSLSASIAELLIDKSAAHARAKHPRLTPGIVGKPPSDEMEDGSIMHSMFLGAGQQGAIVNYDDWRTDEAKFLRKQARKEGRVPILARRVPELKGCVAAAKKQLRSDPDAASLFGPGKAEVVIIVQRDGVYRRIRIDWMPDDPRAPLWDLKFTGMSAATRDWDRAVWQDNALRSAFYLDVAEQARGVRPVEYRLAVIETRLPHAVNIFAAANDVLELGRQQAEDAGKLWASCMKSNRWPGYAKGVKRIELPAWKLQQLQEATSDREWQAKQARKPSMKTVAAVQAVADRFGGPLS